MLVFQKNLLPSSSTVKVDVALGWWRAAGCFSMLAVNLPDSVVSHPRTLIITPVRFCRSDLTCFVFAQLSQYCSR